MSQAIGMGAGVRGLYNAKTKTYFTTIFAIVVLLIIGQILSPGFASAKSISGILGLSVALAAAGIGQTLIIISGRSGLDLSIDSMIPMGALLGAMFAGVGTMGFMKALVVLVILGSLVGLINGVVIRFIDVPPFVMTMGMASVVQGFVIAYTNGQPSGSTPNLLLTLAIGDVWGPIRWIILFGIIVTMIVEWVLRKSRYGSGLFLVGSNRVAARLSGLNINFIVIVTYVVAGISSTLAGFLLLGVVGSGSISMGDGYTLLTVAAVVIGGTQLSGGKGSFFGTVLGSILMIVLSSVLLSINISEGLRAVIQGLILLVIIVLYTREPALRQ